MNLRKLAKDQECMVRIPGVCNHNPETTILAHYSLNGVSGRGLKAPDLIGAWCCSSCHDVIDGRVAAEFIDVDISLMHAEGVFRTQYQLIKRGYIKC